MPFLFLAAETFLHYVLIKNESIEYFFFVGVIETDLFSVNFVSCTHFFREPNSMVDP